MRMMIAIAAAVIMLSLPDAALECLVPSIQRDYWWHKERREAFVLALGEFSNLTRSTKSRARGVDVAPALDYEVWTAEFRGFRASRRAFDQPFQTEVTLVLPDFSVIGGGSNMGSLVDFLPGKTGLVWLMQSEDGYRTKAELCGVLLDTDPANVKPALRCLRGGNCQEPD